MKIKRFSIHFALFLLAWLSAAPVLALDKVKLQLKWKHQFQFAGYYAAKEKGFYRDVGLDVELIEASENISPMDAVISGHAEFGTGTAELLIKYNDNIPVVVLANIFQHSPLQIMVKSNSGINQLTDLITKPVMIEAHSAELIAYLLSHNIKINQIKMMPHSFDTIDLISDRVAAMSVYITDEPFELQQQGINYNLFSPIKSGIDFYGDNLFTTRNQLELYPERVRSFYQASLKGWEYALANPEEIIQIIYQKYSQRHTVPHLRYEAEQTAKLIQREQTTLGQSDSVRWQHIGNIYQRLGMISSIKELDNFIYNPESHTVTDNYPEMAGVITITFFMVAIAFAVLLHLVRNNLVRYRNQFQQTAVASFMLDKKHVVIQANSAAQHLFGWTVTEFSGKSLSEELIHEQDCYYFQQKLTSALEDPKSPQQLYASCQNKCGESLTCHYLISIINNSRGGLDHVLVQALDVTNQLVEQSHFRRYQAAIDSSSDSILTLDTQGFIRSINPATTTMFGYKVHDLVDKPFSFVIANGHDSDDIWAQITNNDNWHGDVNIRHQHGRLIGTRIETSEVHLEDGSSAGYIIVIRDISQLQEYDRKLKIMLNYDQLTGLPNRHLFVERFRTAKDHADNSQVSFAILMINIVNFNQFNQLYGFEAADDLLKHIARRFVRNVHHKDTIARVGIDEFAVLLQPGSTDIDSFSNQLVHELDDPFIIEGNHVTVKVRIGLVTYKQDGETIDQLLNAAKQRLQPQAVSQ